ncbi:hypothetical protein Aduo_007227 [Ancylostoma duodenale]
MTPFFVHNLHVATLLTILLGTTVVNTESVKYNELSNAEISPCNDFYRHACSTQRTSSALRQNLLSDFNEMVDEEVNQLPSAVNRIVADMKEKTPTVDRKIFLDKLIERCGDAQFIDNYLRAANEEIGDSSEMERRITCAEKAKTISDIILDDEREPVDHLMDVIKKVRDMIAFDNLRKKNPKIADAFQLAKNFFKTVQEGYLGFVNSTSGSDQSLEAARWYEKVDGLGLNLPMRAYRFFNSEQLETLGEEYFKCTKNWILGIDSHEKAFCLSRAWRLSAAMTPMPTRLVQYLHDLRSLNVNLVNDRVYVRPAYTLQLLNTTDEAVLMATLGFEMAREITRASYEAPLPTRRCFQQQLSKECSADLDKCSTDEFGYNTVALRAVRSMLQNKLGGNDVHKTRELLYSSAMLNCSSERSPMEPLVNNVLSQSVDFQQVFDCAPSASMVLPQRLIGNSGQFTWKAMRST